MIFDKESRYELKMKKKMINHHRKVKWNEIMCQGGRFYSISSRKHQTTVFQYFFSLCRVFERTARRSLYFNIRSYLFFVLSGFAVYLLFSTVLSVKSSKRSYFYHCFRDNTMRICVASFSVTYSNLFS